MTDTAGMVADLTSTNSQVQGNSWVSPELGGSGGALGLLGSTLDPLSGLAEAGLGWFTSFVSFLGDGLNQLQGGSPDSVSSGSQGFATAGQGITSLAGSYGDSVTQQTSNWTGAAATDYRTAATQHADGVAGLGTASSTVGSSIIGAGQVVAQAISDITELISEAVAQIVPILTQAVARAQQTMGESVLEAIPPCVGIAVEYAMKIASKLAALLASGQNLLQLVQGALGVVDLIQQALSSISQQSTQSGTDGSSATATGGGQQQAASTTSPVNASDAPAGGGATAPSSAGAGSVAASDAGSSLPTDLSSLGGSQAASVPTTMPDLSGATVPATGPLDTTQSAAVIPPLTGTTPAAFPTHAAAAVTSTSGAPGGAVPVGAGGMGLAAGARSAAGQDTETSLSHRLSPPPTEEAGMSEGMPMGRLGSGKPGEKDKEHKRKYTVLEQHEDVGEPVAPPVIGEW